MWHVVKLVTPSYSFPPRVRIDIEGTVYRSTVRRNLPNFIYDNIYFCEQAIYFAMIRIAPCFAMCHIARYSSKSPIVLPSHLIYLPGMPRVGTYAPALIDIRSTTPGVISNAVALVKIQMIDPLPTLNSSP